MKEHRAQEVDLKLDACLVEITGDDSAAGVHVSHGEIAPCDFVIVGIGIGSAVTALLAEGAEGEKWRRSRQLPSNVASWHLRDRRQRVALERVRQGWTGQTGVCSERQRDGKETAAAHIVGQDQPYQAVPWFWSNQYDLKLQTVELSTGYDDHVVRGDPAARTFSVIYLK